MRDRSPFRMFALGVIVASQVFFITSTIGRHSSSPYVPLRHPAQKEFTVDTTQMKDHLVLDYKESFTKEGTDFTTWCGLVSQQRWFPKLHSDDEHYAAFLRDDKYQTNSRDFGTLNEAEQWLFAHDCPSNTWGLTQ